MTEILRDTPQPQFLSPEATDFLLNALDEFDLKRPDKSRLGAAALAAVVEPERLDVVSADPELEKAFTGYLYDGVLLCLDRVNPVVSGKRYHPSEEQRLVQQANILGTILTAGSLAPLTLEHLPIEQRQHARYCMLLAEQVTWDLDLLEYDSLDQVIQRLRGDYLEFSETSH